MATYVSATRSALAHLEAGVVDLVVAGPTARYTYGFCQSSAGDFYLTHGSMILKCDGDTLKVEVHAGSANAGHTDGELNLALFETPLGLMWHEEKIWVVQSHSIRHIYADRVETYVGSSNSGHKDGDFSVVKLNNPTHIVELNGLYYVTDSFNHCIRVIDPIHRQVSSIGYGPKSSIDGTFANCGFKYPRGICKSLDGHIFVVESGGSGIRDIDLAAETVSAYAFNFGKDFRFALSVMHTSNDEIYVCDTAGEAIIYLTSERRVGRLIGLDTATAECDMKNASTRRPTTTLVTPNGDLFWTEELGKLRYVRGLFPPSHKLVLDYSSMLNEESTFSALKLHHTPSERTFLLNESLLALIQVRDIHAIANYDASAQQIQRFFAFLYGAMDLHNPITSAEDLAWMVVLADVSGIPKELTTWLKLQFSHAVQHLAHIAFSALVTSVSASKILYQSSFLRLCLSNDATKRATPGPTSFSLEDALASELNKVSISNPVENDIESIQRNFSPSIWLQERFSKLCKDFRLSVVSDISDNTNPSKAGDSAPVSHDTSTLLKPNFWFVLDGPNEGSQPSLGLNVHDWVMSTRWPYFQRMLASGFDESQTRRASLPSGFPASLLLPFVKFVYSAVIDDENLNPSDCKYLLENGGEFGVLDFEGNAPPIFDALIRYCKTKVTCMDKIPS